MAVPLSLLRLLYQLQLRATEFILAIVALQLCPSRACRAKLVQSPVSCVRRKTQGHDETLGAPPTKMRGHAPRLAASLCMLQLVSLGA